MKWLKERNLDMPCINHTCKHYCANEDIQNCDAECGGGPAIEFCNNYIPDLSMIIKLLEKENEALKCCGNCRHRDFKFMGTFYSEKCEKGKICGSHVYCDDWDFDTLNRKDREVVNE
jgi:hypothetical protein